MGFVWIITSTRHLPATLTLLLVSDALLHLLIIFPPAHDQGMEMLAGSRGRSCEDMIGEIDDNGTRVIANIKSTGPGDAAETMSSLGFGSNKDENDANGGYPCGGGSTTLVEGFDFQKRRSKVLLLGEEALEAGVSRLGSKSSSGGRRTTLGRRWRFRQ